MDPRPDVAVIIPAHNAATTIEAQLDAVAIAMKAAPPAEIVVVDNRSTDDTVARVAQWKGANDVAVRVISAPDGATASYARNRGIAAAEANLLCFCDADDVVQPGWLAAMTDALADHPVVTGPLDLDTLNPTWLADVRGRSASEKPALLFDRLAYAHSCNLGVRRSSIDAVDGFDEDYAIGEDLDLAMRLNDAGVPLHFCPEAIVAYRLRSGLRETYRQARGYGRAQVRIRRRVEAEASLPSPWSPLARRVAWSLRSVPRALINRPTRFRVGWTAGLAIGELQGRWRTRGGRT